MSVGVPPGPLYTGTSLTLTCNIALNIAVNSRVDVNVIWSGPGGMLPVNNNRVTVSDTMGSNTSYQSILTISPLATVDGGSYTCEVTVAPREATTFITISQPANDTGSVAVSGRITSLDTTLPSLPSTRSSLQCSLPSQTFQHQMLSSLVMAVQLLESRTH